MEKPSKQHYHNQVIKVNIKSENNVYHMTQYAVIRIILYLYGLSPQRNITVV